MLELRTKGSTGALHQLPSSQMTIAIIGLAQHEFHESSESRRMELQSTVKRKQQGSTASDPALKT